MESAAGTVPTQGSKNLRLAIKDLADGLSSARIWSMLAWQDVKQRYRRSLLGPLWLTISAGVLIASMGPLYSKLFGQPLNIYLPFLSVGLVLWQMISQTVSDACHAYISAEGFIKHIKLPYSLYILRAVWKNMIVFFHNLLVVLVVFLFLPPPIGWTILLLPISLLLLGLNSVWVGIVLALVSTRFRDIPQIVSSVLQVAFFVTPIMWQSELLGRHAWTVDFNPLFHFIEIVRAPLLGAEVRPISWIFVIACTVLGYALMLFMFSRYRGRIAFWV